jgi:hypothetical protein
MLVSGEFLVSLPCGPFCLAWIERAVAWDGFGAAAAPAGVVGALDALVAASKDAHSASASATCSAHACDAMSDLL